MNSQRRRARPLPLFVALLLLAPAPAAGASHQEIELGSSDRSGRALGGGDHFLPNPLDRHGRYLLFRTATDGIAPGDADGEADVFLKDLATGKVEWISVGVGGSAQQGDISADGRFVAFYADRTYLRDVRRGTTTVVDDQPPYALDAPAVSDDGTTVAFRDATRLNVADVTTGSRKSWDVGDGAFFDLTPDGRWIVFDERFGSTARLLRIDLSTGSRTTIYQGPGGAGTGPVLPHVDADASVISFSVSESFRPQAFVWDSGAVRPLSQAPLSTGGQVSDDGQRILVAVAEGLEDDTADLLVVDRADGAARAVATTSAAWSGGLSGDGGTLSWATDEGLVAADDNGAPDVYATRLARHPGEDLRGGGQGPANPRLGS